jgi:hypothetical protein
VDVDAFLAEIEKIDPSQHGDLHEHTTHVGC